MVNITLFCQKKKIPKLFVFTFLLRYIFFLKTKKKENFNIVLLRGDHLMKLAGMVGLETIFHINGA